MSADKRSSNRVPLNTKVHLEFEKFSGFVSEFSHNISPGGMFIKTPNPLPIGSIVSFEFKLKDSFQLIQGLGEVSWIRSNMISPEEPAGMGIRFREISDRSRDLIKAIVTQTKSQGDEPFDIDNQPDVLTSMITDENAQDVYGSVPLKDGLSSVPSDEASASVSHEQNTAAQALKNMDAHLIDNTVSNPLLNDTTQTQDKDPSQLTHTAMYENSDDQSLGFELDDPLTSPDDDNTFASMEDPDFAAGASSGLSDSFELSLDEEMNDPDFDHSIKNSDENNESKSSSNLGLTVFLSLLFLSLLASAFLLKDLYLPTLKQIPFVAQLLGEPQNIAAIQDDQNKQNVDTVEKTIQSLTKNETPVENLDSEGNIVSTDSSQNLQSQKQDVAAQIKDKTEKPLSANKADSDTKKQETRSKPKKTALATKSTPTVSKPSNKPQVKNTKKETREVQNTPAAANAKPTGQTANSDLLTVKNLTWTVDKDDWVLVIETDKVMDKNNIVHSSLRSGPSRELVMLKGMQKNFSNRTIPVEQTGVYRIRTGYHVNKTPAELHIVIDVLNPQITMKTVQVLGTIVKIYFGAPSAQ